MSVFLTLLLSFGLASPVAAPVSEQSICPGETERGRAVAIRFATGQVRGTRHPEIPIVDPSEVRVLVDSNPLHRYACENLSQLVAQHRVGGKGLSEYQMTYYSAGGVYYAVAVPANPVVTRTSATTFQMDLRYIPLFVTRPNFQLLTVAAM
jgi:hypothetical protein